MSETLDYVFPEYADDYEAMVRRRLFSLETATEPVDFYAAGFQQVLTRTTLGESNVSLDIGCSSGEFHVRAAKDAGVRAQLIGLDPHSEAYERHPPDAKANFRFIKAWGHDIPLADSSVDMVSAHNVLFRASEPSAILQEAKRVLRPDGWLTVSTNGIRHAFFRHVFERMVALRVVQQDRSRTQAVSWPHPPAERFYFERAAAIVDTIGGLTIAATVRQKCESHITPAFVPDYLQSIKETASRANLTAAGRRQWSHEVDHYVAPLVWAQIDKRRKRLQSDNEPYFYDTVDRGMLVIQKTASD